MKKIFCFILMSVAISFYSCTLNAQNVSTQVADTENAVTRILYPEGGTYSHAGAQTGAIAVQLPRGYSGTMLRMRLEVYNYAINESMSMWVAGYTANNWANPSAQILTSSHNRHLAVRFGDIGEGADKKAMVWIGDEDTNWTHIKVEIAEIMVSQSNYAIDDWDNGWQISISNDFMDDVDKTVPASSSLPLGQMSDISNGVSRILHPRGGTYSHAGAQTGAIAVQLPRGYSGTMLRMRLEVYNYATNESMSMWVAGYTANNWATPSAQILTSSHNRHLAVRFGDIGEGADKKAMVWIGDEDTNWTSIKVEIAEIMVSQSNYAIDDWDNGWQISISNDFMDDVDKTVPASSSLPLGQMSDISNGVSRILHPRGGTYSHAGAQTGAIAVQLPRGYTATRVRMRLEIMEYATKQSMSVWVAGFTHNNWVAPSAQILTSSHNRHLPVHFGDIGEGADRRAMVWIGDENTNWNHISVEIAEVVVAQVNYAIDHWDNGWNISVSNDFIGNVDKTQPASSTLPLGQMSDISNGLSRILHPRGGTYTHAGIRTGGLAIQLPRGYSATMLRMRVEVYNYETNQSMSMWIAGYTANNWAGPSAQLLTSSYTRHLPVHFGDIGEGADKRAVVWIGNEDTKWNSIKVNIAEVILAQSNYTIDRWDNGWEISVSDDFEDRIRKTISTENTLPIAKRPKQVAEQAAPNSVTRILYPEGASYASTGHPTGGIQIQLPQGYINKMVKMRVEVQQTVNKESFSMWISGYMSSGWNYPSAQLISSGNGRVFPVRFGAVTTDEGTKVACWIGDETTAWKHLKVHVAEVMVSYNNNSISAWDDGWKISVSNDFMSSVSKTVTPENTLPIAQAQTTLSNLSEGVIQIKQPKGGTYSLWQTKTGAIQVQLPQPTTINKMLRMRLEIYNSEQDESMSVWVGGYTYNNWWRTSAQLLTNSNEKVLPVRFGSIMVNGVSKGAIWIGNEDTQWKSAKIELAEVMVGHSALSLDNWETGWNISITNDFMDNVNSLRTIENPLPLAQTIWTTEGNNTYTNEQHIAIGLEDAGDFRLAVDGDIKARRIKVTAADWPDYVFEPSYELMTIEEVQAYVTEHGHLPNVPSKTQAETEGVYLNDMNNILLQKVEELTLYIIEQEKRIEEIERKLGEERKKKEKTVLND